MSNLGKKNQTKDQGFSSPARKNEQDRDGNKQGANSHEGNPDVATSSSALPPAHKLLDLLDARNVKMNETCRSLAELSTKVFAQAWDTALVDKSVGGAQAGEKCAWPVAAACVFAASKLNDEENVTTSLTAALTETHTERSGGQGNPEDRAKAKKGQFKGMYASGNKKHGKI